VRGRDVRDRSYTSERPAFGVERAAGVR